MPEVFGCCESALAGLPIVMVDMTNLGVSLTLSVWNRSGRLTLSLPEVLFQPNIYGGLLDLIEPIYDYKNEISEAFVSELKKYFGKESTKAVLEGILRIIYGLRNEDGSPFYVTDFLVQKNDNTEGYKVIIKYVEQP